MLNRFQSRLGLGRVVRNAMRVVMGGHAIMVVVGHPHVMMATLMEGPFMIVMVAGIDVKKLPLDAQSCSFQSLQARMMIMLIMF